MVSACIGENRPKSGKRAVELLDGFVDFFIVQKIWNDEETKKKLLCVDQDFELVPCALIESALPTVNHKSAYRTFGSVDELFDCLSFLPQQGYKDYSRIFFVPREQSSGMPIECIDETIPLRRVYTLHYPEDCSSPSGKTEIMEGEELKLVYTKQGLEPFEKYIKGGENSNFAFVEGNTMHIRSGKEIGLIHNRVIEIICKDKSDKRIYDFSLRNYTQQNNTITIQGKTVIIPENEQREIIVWVDPRDEKYDSQKVNLTGVLVDHKDVCLETKNYNVVFKMNGRTFKTTEDTMMSPSEAKNNWDEYDCEINDLDRVVCFTVHRFSPEKKHHEKTHFVREELPLGKRIGNFFKDWWRLMLVIVTLLLLAYGIYAAIARFWLDKTPWPFETKTEEVEESTGNLSVVQSEAVDEAVNEQEKNVFDSTALHIQNDIDYLKVNDVWTKNNIKSKKYQDLFDNIANGWYGELIAQNDSLFGEGVKQNGYYKDIIRRLNILTEQGDNKKLTQASNIMKDSYSNGSIDIENIQKEIQKIMTEGQSNNQQNHSTSNSNMSTSTSSSGNNTTSQRPKSD
jgi:hypothetical protein